MRIDLARLNHVLIPKTKEERDRLRRGLLGRVFGPVVDVLWSSLTDEGRTLLVVTPLAGAVAVDVQRTSAYVLFALLAGLLVGSVVASRGLRLGRASVSVRAPRRVTVGEEATFRVSCRREASPPDGAVAIRIRGPFLTWDGTWTGRPPHELLVRAGGSAEATMQARFSARGLHHLDPFTAARVAPLGLACGPRLASEGVKLHVVPRVANVTRVPVPSHRRERGVPLARRGEGAELLGVRPYRPGDPVRALHARTWARTGVPAVREHQQEHLARAAVALDTTTRDPDLLEAALELAAGVVAHLSSGDALVDALVIGDRVHELGKGRGAVRLDRALELLASAERAPLDEERLLERLASRLPELSAIVMIVPDGSAPNTLARRLEARRVAVVPLAIDPRRARAIRAQEPLAW